MWLKTNEQQQTFYIQKTFKKCLENLVIIYPIINKINVYIFKQLNAYKAEQMQFLYLYKNNDS